MLSSLLPVRLPSLARLLLLAPLTALPHCGTSSSPASAADASPLDSTTSSTLDASTRADAGRSPCLDAAGIMNPVCVDAGGGLMCTGVCSSSCALGGTSAAYCNSYDWGGGTGGWVCTPHSCGTGPGSGGVGDASAEGSPPTPDAATDALLD